IEKSGSSDLDQSDDSETQSDSEHGSDSGEIWDATLGEHLDEDILNPPPIPEPALDVIFSFDLAKHYQPQ
ncbi:Hypothetical predicted protein, partial [Paramuricea clavata]